MDKFPGNPKAAENVYKEAILKGESIVGEDFTRTEEDRINKAKTPEEITAPEKTSSPTTTPSATSKKNERTIEEIIIVEYTTETLVMGKPYPQTTKGIETLKHLSEEVDKVHEFIVKRIETETNLDKFPSEEEIKSTYQEKKVPDTRSKITYQNIENIEVLKVKKADIDNEIKKVNDLVQKISNFKHLRELYAIQSDIDKQFQELKRELLPPNKDQEITNIDGGMDQTELEQIKNKMKDRTWDSKNYDQINTKVINSFLKMDRGIQEMNQSLDEQIKNEKDPTKKQALEAQKMLQPGRGYEDLDQPNEKLYGTNEEGEPNNDIVEFEEKLPKEKRGSSLLEFFYSKSKDGKNRDFDPHKYVNSPEASQFKTITKTKEIDVIGGDKGTQGHLAMAAGVGKTTKSINCLLNGGKEHIVLVAPLFTLSKRVRVLKGTLKEATQQEIDEGQAEEQPVEIYESHGGAGIKEGKKGLSILYYGYLLGYIAREKSEIKSKLLPKDSIFVFDEAHYNSGAYQALQLKMVQAGYKVLRMSATFPGVPFSTTSTYSKKSYHCAGELEPKMPGYKLKIQNEKHAEALAKHRGKSVWMKDLDLYSLIAFSPVYKEICETVSFGRQPGAVLLGNFEHQMGVTFEIDTVISTGLIKVSNLGKNFTFSDEITQFNPISSDIQEQGRGGRIQEALWVILTKECQEIIVEEDVEAAMVKSVFDGDIQPIKEAEYPFYDIKMLWGGLAHPHRFGKPPAEALIGLKVDDNEKERVKNKQPLTKIVYLDEVPPVTMGVDAQQELLKELISNFIAKDRSYPKGLNMRNQSNLIGAVYGQRLASGENEKTQVAEEIRNVLNGAIEKEIKKFIKDKVFDSNYLRSKDPKVIRDIVDLYRLNNAKVYFTFEPNEEKKDEEKEIRIKQKARRYLETDEDVAGSPTLRSVVEETLQPNTQEAFYSLLEKLRNAPYYNKLVSYKGDKRIRERTKAFLRTDTDIAKSETLKKLVEEAIAEDTMDGYYNLLTSFRKNIAELEKLKGNEDNANDFLARMTGVQIELNKRTEQLEKKNGREQKQINQLKEEITELKKIIIGAEEVSSVKVEVLRQEFRSWQAEEISAEVEVPREKIRIMDAKQQFKITDKEKLKTNPLFTIVPATEKAAEHISKLYKTIDNLEEIIKRLETENEDLKKKLGKYEPNHPVLKPSKKDDLSSPISIEISESKQIKDLQNQVKFHANQAQNYLKSLQQLTAENDLLKEKAKKGVNYQLAESLKEANQKIRELEKVINKSNTLIDAKDETISLYEKIIDELGSKKGASNQKHESQIFSQILASNLPPKKIKEKLGDIYKKRDEDMALKALAQIEQQKIRAYDKLEVKDLPKDWKVQLKNNKVEIQELTSKINQKTEELKKWIKQFPNHTPEQIYQERQEDRKNTRLLKEWTDRFAEKKPGEIEKELKNKDAEITILKSQVAELGGTAGTNPSERLIESKLREVIMAED
ncbi:36825_t:CDS:10 [Gigaspora margarita]|uniref:36825_t:CDS:1 n=1 Tax=Gigaspora margarita TaxID=4874 RepID=A0ABM8W712_GIGMA|nr:36825_t:CDS:10 [Gigaspora margarita]